MYYAFKPNPKQLVVNKAVALYGRDKKVDVSGRRPTPPECKTLEIPVGSYYVQCSLGGEVIASTHTKDWRKAYNLLVVEVEKAFEKSLWQDKTV